jgi:hypothetical protein
MSTPAVLSLLRGWSGTAPAVLAAALVVLWNAAIYFDSSALTAGRAGRRSSQWHDWLISEVHRVVPPLFLYPHPRGGRDRRQWGELILLQPVSAKLLCLKTCCKTPLDPERAIVLCAV